MTFEEEAKAKTNAKRKIWRGRNIFALYKGDEFLDIGDKYELAEKFGLSPDSVTWLGTPSGKKKFYEHGATGYTVVNLTAIEDKDL